MLGLAGRLADGTRVLPEGWIADSITPSIGLTSYGYFWWLTEGVAYQALGIFGQAIYVDPERDVVIALHSARAQASDDWEFAMQEAMCAALSRGVSKT